MSRKDSKQTIEVHALCNWVRGCSLGSRGLCFFCGTCQLAETNYNHSAEFFPLELQARVSWYEVRRILAIIRRLEAE